MVIHGVVAALLVLNLNISVPPIDKSNFLATTPEYTNIGEYRISIFCKYCNEPQGTESASGKTLQAGHVATRDLPMGSEIAIEGEEFEVTDICGVDNTIDIYVENDSGYCKCDKLFYEDVYLKTE